MTLKFASGGEINKKMAASRLVMRGRDLFVEAVLSDEKGGVRSFISLVKFASGGEINKKMAASRLGLRRSWRELQSSDTDVGAVRDAMSMAVSHHAAAFTDGLQDVNYCHRVMVVGFKLLPERMLFFNGCLEFTVSTKCPYLRHLWRSLWSLSKLQSLFNQISFHTSQARNLKQRRT
ncbi:hypothetical protein HID58_020429 [Brassica napus]|uniref:Uncharacterized protein n=1 Tax=Brassica napus TaxID=3708 RepID=A0ABQ7XGW1_BRANA|nr:hypothetical protein HID58_020429 [Brassica napus]